MMLMTIVESNKGKGDPEKSYEEFARSFPPIISWTNYIAVVCGVVTRLPFDLKIAPGPEKDDVRILSWSGVKPKAPARYWFGFRDGALQNQKDLSKPPPAHLGISGMVRWSQTYVSVSSLTALSPTAPPPRQRPRRFHRSR